MVRVRYGYIPKVLFGEPASLTTSTTKLYYFATLYRLLIIISPLTMLKYSHHLDTVSQFHHPFCHDPKSSQSPNTKIQIPNANPIIYSIQLKLFKNPKASINPINPLKTHTHINALNPLKTHTHINPLKPHIYIHSSPLKLNTTHHSIHHKALTIQLHNWLQFLNKGPPSLFSISQRTNLYAADIFISDW